MRLDLFARHAATAVIAICVTVVAGSLLALAVPEWRRALGLPAPDGPAYSAGDPVDVPAGIYGAAPLTLLLFTRSDCRACQAGKPALSGLIGMLHDRTTVRVVMIVNQGTEAAERQYLHEIGLDEGGLAGVDFSALRVQRVPTMVLVDRQGNVRYYLEGPPSALDHAELLRIAQLSHAVR